MFFRRILVIFIAEITSIIFLIVEKIVELI